MRVVVLYTFDEANLKHLVEFERSVAGEESSSNVINLEQCHEEASSPQTQGNEECSDATSIGSASLDEEELVAFAVKSFPENWLSKQTTLSGSQHQTQKGVATNDDAKESQSSLLNELLDLLRPRVMQVVCHGDGRPLEPLLERWITTLPRLTQLRMERVYLSGTTGHALAHRISAPQSTTLSTTLQGNHPSQQQEGRSDTMTPLASLELCQCWLTAAFVTVVRDALLVSSWWSCYQRNPLDSEERHDYFPSSLRSLTFIAADSSWSSIFENQSNKSSHNDVHREPMPLVSGWDPDPPQNLGGIQLAAGCRSLQTLFLCLQPPSDAEMDEFIDDQHEAALPMASAATMVAELTLLTHVIRLHRSTLESLTLQGPHPIQHLVTAASAASAASTWIEEESSEDSESNMTTTASSSSSSATQFVSSVMEALSRGKSAPVVAPVSKQDNSTVESPSTTYSCIYDWLGPALLLPSASFGQDDPVCGNSSDKLADQVTSPMAEESCLLTAEETNGDGEVVSLQSSAWGTAKDMPAEGTHLIPPQAEELQPKNQCCGNKRCDTDLLIAEKGGEKDQPHFGADQFCCHYDLSCCEDASTQLVWRPMDDDSPSTPMMAQNPQEPTAVEQDMPETTNSDWESKNSKSMIPQKEMQSYDAPPTPPDRTVTRKMTNTQTSTASTAAATMVSASSALGAALARSSKLGNLHFKDPGIPDSDLALVVEYLLREQQKHEQNNIDEVDAFGPSDALQHILITKTPFSVG